MLRRVALWLRSSQHRLLDTRRLRRDLQPQHTHSASLLIKSQQRSLHWFSSITMSLHWFSPLARAAARPRVAPTAHHLLEHRSRKLRTASAPISYSTQSNAGSARTCNHNKATQIHTLGLDLRWGWRVYSSYASSPSIAAVSSSGPVGEASLAKAEARCGRFCA